MFVSNFYPILQKYWKVLVALIPPLGPMPIIRKCFLKVPESASTFHYFWKVVALMPPPRSHADDWSSSSCNLAKKINPLESHLNLSCLDPLLT